MRIEDIEKGILVEIISAAHTEITFGLTDGMLGVGDKAVVLDIYFGENGVALDDEYTYHVRDLKKVEGN